MEKGQFVTEPVRQVVVKGEADVLVIGGGFAGVAAAVAASRGGKKVILLEKNIALGGLGTLGHVCVYLPLCDGLGHKIYGGLAEELMYTAIRYGYNTIPAGWSRGQKAADPACGRYRSHFNVPACVMAMDELMEEHGVEVVFDALFSRPIMEGKRCAGVIVETKSGREAYLGRMVVDASGDADVMYRAGASCVEQPSIVSHWAYEVDRSTMEKGLETGQAIDAFALRWIGLRPDADNSKSEMPRYHGTTSEGVNGYVRYSRRLALDFLKEHQQKDYAMLTLPTMAQFRTTRRITGAAELVLEAGAHRPDSVGCVHNCLENPAAVYEFPYGAVIDPALENMLAAGRIVAAGGVGWEIMRYIPGCVFTGQVAGTAAALAIDHNTTVQDIPLPLLQRQLAQTGVMVHMDEQLRHNKGKPAHEDPTKQFDPHIRNDNLAYVPH